MTKIAVTDLKPNPFRNIERYPISREKVDALKRSMKATTFWDNLLARKNGDGYEIAFGHHRLTALREAKTETIDIPVRKLSDTEMAQIMAHENMEEWGSSATVEQETVRAIVKGYADGKIELPKPTGITKGSLRFAPRFGTGEPPFAQKAAPYTIETLKQFLGWSASKVEGALDALSIVEEDIADDDDFANLNTTQAKVAAQQGRRALNRTGDKKQAAAVVKTLTSGMRQATGREREADKASYGAVTPRSAKRVADEMIGLGRQIQKTKVPDINRFVTDLVKILGRTFVDREDEFGDIVKFQEHLTYDSRRLLINSLKSLSARALQIVSKLEA